MPPLNLDYVALTIGRLRGVGPGIVGRTAWTIALGTVLLLGAIAWWTMKPARRASQAELGRGRRTTSTSEEHPSTDSDGRADNAVQSRTTRSP